MTDCKNKILTFAAAAGIALSVFSAETKAATDDVYLIPPVSLLPSKKSAANALGLFEADKNAPLNGNLWQNTAFPTVAEKFGKIPHLLPAAAEDLRMRLLLTAGNPPQGTVGQAFITLKLNRLFERGATDEAFKLIHKIPEKTRATEQNKINADVLLTRDLQPACYLNDRNSDNVFWLHLAAVCAAHDKNARKTAAALESIREQSRADAFIENAAEHFLKNEPLTARPATVTPLVAAVWRASGRSLTELKGKTNALWFEKMFVADETIPVEKRLETAEKLVQAGILPPAKLRMYYQQARTSINLFPPELTRARMVQNAAALTSTPDDNMRKHHFIRQGMISAEQSGVSYAFAAAAKDILISLRPDADTLPDSVKIIKAFTLAGLNDQAVEWQTKAERIFPKSEAAAKSWIYALFAQPDKNRRFFISSLERLMAYAEKHGEADADFIRKIDRAMLLYKLIGLIPENESWFYSSFAPGSPSAAYAAMKSAPPLAKNMPVSIAVLDALDALGDGFDGLARAVALLNAAGLNDAARNIALQSLDDALTVHE